MFPIQNVKLFSILLTDNKITKQFADDGKLKKIMSII